MLQIGNLFPSQLSATSETLRGRGDPNYFWDSLWGQAGDPSLVLLFLWLVIVKILGAVILGFGIWILADKTSFIAVLRCCAQVLQQPMTGAYILIGVGALTMLMGFLGCLGAVNEIRCLLGLYFSCLMIILLAQIAAALVIYFQKETLKAELSKIVVELIENYDPADEDQRNLRDAWDYVQTQGCMDGVEQWLKDNLGIILGVCTGVAVIEITDILFKVSKDLRHMREISVDCKDPTQQGEEDSSAPALPLGNARAPGLYEPVEGGLGQRGSLWKV
ncbi:hypothetical protein IHE44_0014045 [Lamprotornis superbus]|uniref:Tetraspanin n=1 Tax=Lamprotornis superbus TaxID=245042 RepID=A0A835NRL1_9PASS|nr:hypothetical protein IHE44_0014045 [Lamprotornis superbus]